MGRSAREARAVESCVLVTELAKHGQDFEVCNRLSDLQCSSWRREGHIRLGLLVPEACMRKLVGFPAKSLPFRKYVSRASTAGCALIRLCSRYFRPDDECVLNLSALCRRVWRV